MKWKPIKTAPKDGTEILLYTEAGQVMEGYWADKVYTGTGEGCWSFRLYNAENDIMQIINWSVVNRLFKKCSKITKKQLLKAVAITEVETVAPTHWMPLPLLPKT